MKILVPVKRVPDSNVALRVHADGSGPVLDGVKMVINPFDEIAVEAALQIKEAGKADEVIVVTIGAKAAQDVLRAGQAMGADRGILVLAEQAPDGLGVARILATIAREENADLVLLGKQSTDSEHGQVGQMVAGLLDWPQATFAARISVAEGELTVEREVDAGTQTLALPLPAVVSADLRLAAPRFVSLPNVMQARKKPIAERRVEDFGQDLSPRLTVLRTEAESAGRAGTILASVDELLERLSADQVL